MKEQPKDTAFPSVQDFDRSYADATPEQRDQMLENAQWVLQLTINGGPRPDAPLEEVVTNHEGTLGCLIAVLNAALSAIRYERREHGPEES